MEQQRIKITIAKDGGVDFQTEGFKGHACAEATQEIEVMIGSVKSTEKTADWYKKDDDKKVFETR
jgi:hypothetical protein